MYGYAIIMFCHKGLIPPMDSTLFHHRSGGNRTALIVLASNYPG